MSRIRWRRSWFPAWYGFCPDERCWRRALAASSDPGAPYPEHHGCTTAYDDTEGDRRILVTLAEELDGDHAEALGVLVHESVHVVHWVLHAMRDRDASWEFEAYAAQAVFSELMADYARTRLRGRMPLGGRRR